MLLRAYKRGSEASSLSGIKTFWLRTALQITEWNQAFCCEYDNSVYGTEWTCSAAAGEKLEVAPEQHPTCAVVCGRGLAYIIVLWLSRWARREATYFTSVTKTHPVTPEKGIFIFNTVALWLNNCSVDLRGAHIEDQGPLVFYFINIFFITQSKF